MPVVLFCAGCTNNVCFETIDYQQLVSPNVSLQSLMFVLMSLDFPQMYFSLFLNAQTLLSYSHDYIQLLCTVHKFNTVNPSFLSCLLFSEFTLKSSCLKQHKRKNCSIQQIGHRETTKVKSHQYVYIVQILNLMDDNFYVFTVATCYTLSMKTNQHRFTVFILDNEYVTPMFEHGCPVYIENIISYM